MLSPQFLGRHIPSPPPSPTTSASYLRPFSTTITATTTATAATTSLSTPSSLYDILNLPPTATFPEIKSAYRHLARTCHPDTSPNNSSDEFLRLHTAYATLTDPDQRAAYDRRLLVLHRRQSTPPRQQPNNGATETRYANFARSPSFPGFYGRKKRTWETDQCW